MIVALAVGGSDPSGGAGIQADLLTWADHGVYGATAITAVTAQHAGMVSRVDVLDADAVVAQLDAVRDALPVAVVKTGMLGSRPIVEALVRWLDAWPDRPPLVVDPVLRATVGASLLDEDALDTLRELTKRAALVTPNQTEAAALAGVEASDADGLANWAASLSAVLVTGGDGGGDDVIDVLHRSGQARVTMAARRLPGGPFHGTGCTLASAAAAGIGAGQDLEESVRQAIGYVRGRIWAADELGGRSWLIRGLRT